MLAALCYCTFLLSTQHRISSVGVTSIHTIFYQLIQKIIFFLTDLSTGCPLVI
ncbi:hypothetical protein Q7O_001782 [Pectobacterium carotovorum subsp. carotovorum PCCS1]|nr:hypothetical protein [Pectobacterium carotovorum subsp. carotovorum PCCS1]